MFIGSASVTLIITGIAEYLGKLKVNTSKDFNWRTCCQYSVDSFRLWKNYIAAYRPWGRIYYIAWHELKIWRIKKAWFLLLKKEPIIDESLHFHRYHYAF